MAFDQTKDEKSGGHIIWQKAAWEDVFKNAYRAKQGVARIQIMKGKESFTFDEARQLDFSFPAYYPEAKNPEWQVFGEKGGRAIPYPFTRKEWENFIEISDSDGVVISFQNSVKNRGTDDPELIAFIPEVKEGFCKRIQNELNKKDVKNQVAITEINFHPDMQVHSGDVNTESQAIKTLPLPIIGKTSNFGCVKYGNIFHFYVIMAEF